jgi:hypothetical protein
MAHFFPVAQGTNQDFGANAGHGNRALPRCLATSNHYGVTAVEGHAVRVRYGRKDRIPEIKYVNGYEYG